MKIVTGNDKCKTWSKPAWSAILDETRLVVSTPQVLYEALSHAFITMERLSLLVFDEGEFVLLLITLANKSSP